MNDHEYRDRPLGDAIDQIPPVARSESFMPDLLRALEAEDTRRIAPDDQAGDKGRLRRLLARRKGSVLAAAGLAAALLLVFMLSGVPGMRETQPPPATAADRLVAAIDAGLAKVNTMQGVMVFDPPLGSWGTPPERALFAATSAGDRLVDVRYKPDWARARSDYRAQLATLRRTKANYSTAEYRRAVSDLKKSGLLVAVRSVYVNSTADHTFSYAFFSSDALTRKLARVKYFDLGWDIGLHTPTGHGDVGRVWALATELRSVMADNPDIAVSDTIYEGRPASLVIVQASDGSPAWEAIVDKQFGVTLAVRVFRNASIRDTGSANADIVAFHVERLQINRPLSPTMFAIKPDYRPASTGHARVAGAPEVQILDATQGSPVRHFFSPAELGSVASTAELVPEAMPPGYRLAEVTRLGNDRQSVLLIYRRGMNEFVVWSGSRVPNYNSSYSGVSHPPGIAAFDRETWPDVSSFGGNEFVRINSGALDGAPAAIFAGVGGPAQLEAWTDTREASIGGNLSRAELLSIAESLRPLKGGGWGRTSANLISLLGVIVVLVAAAVTLTAWFATQRRRDAAGRPQPGVLVWPLVGLALVIAGAGLNWHALLHNGTGYASHGWNEPLGRWVIVLAVMAVVCAAWRQLVTRWRGPVGPKFVAVLLATATLAGAAFALVYLPLEARFTVSNVNGNSVTSESWLMRIFSSQFSPSATTGLYVSILGALFLLVGVVMLRKPEQTAVDAAAPPVPTVPSPSPAPPA
jgi:hypothetical protein